MNKWKVEEVDISDIVPTEVNANSMNKKDFDKLVRNIKKSGLSSMIACYKREDGKYVIISGNHRYKACVKIGYSTLNILYAEEQELTKDEIVALQLSHNTLHGEDDKGILKRLFEEIKGIDYKEFAHISVDDIKVEDMFSASIVPMSEHFTVSLVLYQKDIDNLEELMDIIKEEKSNKDLVILADGNATEAKFLDAISKIKGQYDIKSTSIAFGKILEMAVENKETNETESEEKENGKEDN